MACSNTIWWRKIGGADQCELLGTRETRLCGCDKGCRQIGPGCCEALCSISGIKPDFADIQVGGYFKGSYPEQRLQERQNNKGPLVDEYFAWVKKQLEDAVVPPKSKTADGLRYSMNQGKYLGYSSLTEMSR